MLAVIRKPSSGPTRSFGKFQETACVSKVDMYLLRKVKSKMHLCFLSDTAVAPSCNSSCGEFF